MPIMLGALGGKSPSFTKAGPGRRHQRRPGQRRLQRATGDGSYAQHDAAVSVRLRLEALL